ncbi:MAG: metal-dependent transcriptional regulator [Chloroflexi bacterium]|nr:metal-dependent transcriptional regulator [Chloroflexota bacterium]
MPKQVENVAADDALTTIYRITHDENGEAIAARLAERLGIRPASMAGMVARLSRDHLVSVDPKKRISLTPEGMVRAENMVRRHRLAECLLVNVLKLEWWRAYEEAHLMEHAISDVTEPLIVAMLEDPDRSPFGYPIPGNAHSHPLSKRRLVDLPDHARSVVERVYEEDEELLRFFDQEGIRPGVPIEVIERAPKRGTVTALFGKEQVVLGTDAARLVWVPDR